ncbi:hypothetical protein Ocin01_16433, partial [Orchesella cincta]
YVCSIPRSKSFYTSSIHFSRLLQYKSKFCNPKCPTTVVAQYRSPVAFESVPRADSPENGCLPSSSAHPDPNQLVKIPSVENEIKFYETESNRFLAAVEIRNLTPFAMIYKLFHSNPALEFTEFIISSPFGSLQFDEAISILVAPARFFSREYLDEAVFELWIAPKATLDKKLEIRSNWPKHVKDHVIMKTVMKTVVLDSQQYIEELLMRGVENHHDFDSESIMSASPSLSVYAARAKKREQRKLKKEKPFPKPNEHDLNSSRKVRHFVKQLMEKEKEKERLRYEDKMKQKKPSKHPKLQSSSSFQNLPQGPERETLTIYQREIPERVQSKEVPLLYVDWSWDYLHSWTVVPCFSQSVSISASKLE